ncbi:MAG: threonine synthase [Bacteroidota bacterium]|nr:threonine synthase [Bacteroidota bacterium]
MTAIPETFSYAAALACARCGRPYPIHQIQQFADCCQQPLLVQYDWEPGFCKEDLLFREKTMWRYFEALPVSERKHIISLGEGMTPLFQLSSLGSEQDFADLWMKDESGNPTGSFKARGMSVAISKAKELGIHRCIVPTAGNAGGALAAYCAKAGMECTVVMPRHTPSVFKDECRLYGANLVLVDGLISDCAKKVGEVNREKDWFDLSTLKEPYRLEGKKTMGYELAEQFNWQLPDYILYPAGGGTGLIGIWKAFKEMLSAGWLAPGTSLPKMIAVQSMECAPLVRAFYQPQQWKQGFQPQPSIANGLAVPYPFGMDMMLEVLQQSGGLAMAVSESAIKKALQQVARQEGLLISPEGAATWAALLQLRNAGHIDPGARIVLLNTGSGYKYLENLQ